MNPQSRRIRRSTPKSPKSILRAPADNGYGALSPAWEKELDRRMKEIDGGRIELIPAEQVFAEIEASLRARRGGR